jgi:hypothetical protein
MYAAIGRPSIAPETLLRASLLQAFFTVRVEWLLMERLDCDLMFGGVGIAGFVADLRRVRCAGCPGHGGQSCDTREGPRDDA